MRLLQRRLRHVEEGSADSAAVQPQCKSRYVRQGTDRSTGTSQARPVATNPDMRMTKAHPSARAADQRLGGARLLPKPVLALGLRVAPLRVLVVDSGPMHAVAAALLESPGDALRTTSARAEKYCAEERAFDIILLAVGTSTLKAMVLTAHLRAIERQKPGSRRAAIIACTVGSLHYLECLVPGSGLSGAFSAPWTRATVHACFDQWRDCKRLRALFDCETQNR